MEKEQTLILTGATRTPYTFTVYPWSQPHISPGAVYLILRHEEQGFSIIYVGRSDDLNIDLFNHPLISAFVRAGITHIGVHFEPVFSERYVKQMDLVVNFSPVLNM